MKGDAVDDSNEEEEEEDNHSGDAESASASSAGPNPASSTDDNEDLDGGTMEATDNDDDNDDDDFPLQKQQRRLGRGRPRSSSSAVRGKQHAVKSNGGRFAEDDDSDDNDWRRPRRGAPSGSGRGGRGATAPRRGGGKKRSTAVVPSPARRTSARATKFTASMAEPKFDASSGRDDDNGTTKAPPGRRSDFSSSPAPFTDDEGASDSEGGILASMKATAAVTRRPSQKHAAPNSKSQPPKSPVKRHAARRLSIRSGTIQSSSSSDDGEEYEFNDDLDDRAMASSDDDLEEVDEEEPLKIQKIVASRTETRARWREVCAAVQTSEIENGSRWNQEVGEGGTVGNANGGTSTTTNDDDDHHHHHQIYEERFLIKWKDLSYLHCSWETQADIESQIERSGSCFTTFFRKSHNGLLYSADERCDGDYFDPAYVEIDRILEVQPPSGNKSYPAMTSEAEESATPLDFGVILDKADPNYDDGEGRQFLVKWGNLGYTECSYEFERDLILNEIEYKSHVKEYLRRHRKPDRSEIRDAFRRADALRRRLYRTFSDHSKIGQEQRDSEVAKYKQELLSQVHKNGGQLRDYQAEGIAWMIANLINERGFILADEMGL